MASNVAVIEVDDVGVRGPKGADGSAPTDVSGSLVTATGGTEAHTLADWLAGLGKIEAPPVKGFWMDYGATDPNIWRFRDRVFIGQATVSAGNWDTSNTWLKDAPVSLTWIERGSHILGITDAGSGGYMMSLASRTSDSGLIPSNPGSGALGSIAMSAIAYSDDTVRTEFSGQKLKSYAYYGEAMRAAGAGVTQFMEGDVCNFDPADTSTMGPYGGTGHPSLGIWLASGGGKTGVYDATLGYALVNNGAKFKKGFVFRSNSLTTDGSGYMSAIDLPSKAMVQWHHDATEANYDYITSVNTSANKTAIEFNNSVANFFVNDAQIAAISGVGSPPWNYYTMSGHPTWAQLQATGAGSNIPAHIGAKGTSPVYLFSNGGLCFAADAVSTPVNYIKARGMATTTLQAQLSTEGTDANIDLRILPKGTGGVVANNHVKAGAATAIAAGGSAGIGLLVSSTANFGVFFGSGAPTISAAKGSIYLRSDGSGTADRIYVNTNGTTGWAAITTAS